MMGYMVTLTIVVPIEARSLRVAKERAERLVQAALPVITGKIWVYGAGVGHETEVEEEE